MRFFEPWGFLALLGIPAILLLYMLKQKYQDVSVSSLFLWKAAIANTQAQRPWQKLRKNILMVLQLLAVVLVALALANPYFMGKGQKADYILALDCSMSMQATDSKPSRFEAAKAAVEEIVKNAPPDTGFTLVKAAEKAEILVARTENKQEFLAKLASVSPTYGGVDWEGVSALLLAEKNQMGGNIYIFGDNPQPVEDLPANVSVFANGGQNCAVVHVSHNQGEDGYQSLAQVKNYGSETATRTVALFCDGAVYDTAEITIAPGQEEDVIFTGIPQDVSSFSVRITPEDMLAADDVYYDTATGITKNKTLLVTEGNLFLEKALALLPNIELYKASPQDMDTSGYALYIFDGVLPENLPDDGHIMAFNMPKDNALFSLFDIEQKAVTVRGEGGGRLSFMKQAQFSVSNPMGIPAPYWAEKILDYGGNAIGIAGERDGKKIVCFSFALNQSDFPLKKDFPILLYELSSWYFPASVTVVSNAIAGEPIAFQLLPDTRSVKVTSPSHLEVFNYNTLPVPLFENTGETGSYTLEQADSQGMLTISHFSVNPRTFGESDALNLQNTANVQQTNESTIQKSKSLQKSVVILLLLLLLIEWRVNLNEN